MAVPQHLPGIEVSRYYLADSYLIVTGIIQLHNFSFLHSQRPTNSAGFLQKGFGDRKLWVDYYPFGKGSYGSTSPVEGANRADPGHWLIGLQAAGLFNHYYLDD
jgi:hypothetical protein